MSWPLRFIIMLLVFDGLFVLYVWLGSWLRARRQSKMWRDRM